VRGRIDSGRAECLLCEYMMRRPRPGARTRAMLFGKSWNYKSSPQSNLVDVTWGRLRRKIDR